MRYSRLAFTGAVVLLLSACYTTPMRPIALDDARLAIDAARANPDVMTFAADELQEAVATYVLAESMLRRDGYSSEVRRLTYLAQQRAAMAQEIARRRFAEQAIPATPEREHAQLAARGREMQEAPSALLAEAHAETARRAVLEAEARARVAQQQPVFAQQQRAPSSAERRVPLESQLREIAAVKSDRGMVVTLNDVLFDTGSALLRPGGQRLVARLAELLREYPERTIAIEGFSDSTGSDAQSQELSEQRAAAVKLALMDAGVDGSRVFVRGYGKAFPVATNGTGEGRQRNRRVEVVISDERGSIAPRVASVGR
jgi:outer membrane protein OmpA-like peptidoglycan-associated protein